MMRSSIEEPLHKLHLRSGSADKLSAMHESQTNQMVIDHEDPTISILKKHAR